MLVITQLQPITALFTLPEDQLQAVAQHMRGAPLQVDAYSRDDQTKIASGKLLTIDNQIDQTTGTARLKAVFENKGSELWPNQFVNIHLLLETRRNATVIPTAAVQRGPQGNYVYVVKSDKTVEVRPVNIAITEGNVAQIDSGLSPDESVVTDGQDKLQPGGHVEPHSQAASPTGGNVNPAARNPNSSNSNANSPNSNSGARGPRNRQVPPDTGKPNTGTASQ